jgi:hypothetical protein
MRRSAMVKLQRFCTPVGHEESFPQKPFGIRKKAPGRDGPAVTQPTQIRHVSCQSAVGM